MNLSRRIFDSELMDTLPMPMPEMRKTLEFLEITNKYFGGAAVVFKYLSSWSKRWNRNQAIRILDIGTGNASIPCSIARWARKKGFPVHITGIDIIPDIVHIAQQNAKEFSEITIKESDFLSHQEQSQQNEKYDYAIASLLFHHLSSDSALHGLQIMDAIASRGIIVSDLHRTQAGYLMVTAASKLLGNSIVQNDGPLSVRRSFRLHELNELAQKSGLNYLTPRKEPWFRISLTGEK